MFSHYSLETLAASIADQCKPARKTSQGYMACCPAHKDTHPSLRIFIGTARVVLYCFADCPDDAITARLGLTLDERAMIARSRSLPTLSPRARAPKVPQDIPDAPARRARLKQVWLEAKPITAGDPVGLYLTRRGLWHEPIPKTLRYHTRLEYWDRGICSYHPALIAAIQGPSDTVVTLHRIYLARSGEKAAVPTPKKLMRSPSTVRGAAVRLDRAGPELLVAEGIETALAVRKTTGLPTWAAISAGGVKNLVLPPVVELVIIAADNDANGVGQDAARFLAERLVRQGRNVKICIPETPNSDWADGVEEVYGG